MTTDFLYKERVTVIDVLEAGACIEGVKAFVKKKGIIAARADDFIGEKWIQKAANNRFDGYYGNGYGYVYYGYYSCGDGCGDATGTATTAMATPTTAADMDTVAMAWGTATTVTATGAVMAFSDGYDDG